MEISDVTKKYWTPEDWEDLEKATTIKEMYAIMCRVLEKIPHPRVQVCGPIATGGLGNLDDNLHAFNETIKKLQEQGLNVIDQMPFEYPIQKLKTSPKEGEYFLDILNDFYHPLFQLKMIDTFYFMPNWQSSKGATWEHEQAKALGATIVYL
jgi:hypothetical protein